MLGQATGPYDDAKAWLVVTLAAVTMAVALIRSPGGLGMPRALDGATRIVRWVVLAYAAWLAVATALSLIPGLSLVGNFGRGLGLLVLLGALAPFVLSQAWATSAERARALLDAALWGSVPVCALAVGQLLGWDPLPRSWDPVVSGLRVRSTFGQHIFLGSYLVVLAPLALARLDWALRERAVATAPREGGGARAAHLAMAGWALGAVAIVAGAAGWPALWWALPAWGLAGALLWALRPAPLPPWALGLLLAAHVAVVLAAQARGALLGLAVGLAAAGVPILLARRARRILLAGGALAAAGLVAVVVVSLPGSPFATHRRAPALHRAARGIDLTRGSPEWFRVQVWRGIATNWAALLAGEPVVPVPNPTVRALVGYGPETQLRTLDRLAMPSIGMFETRGDAFRAHYLVDRAHSVALDHLVTVGLVGGALWLAATAAVLAVGGWRLRAAAGPEQALRAGALGAVAGQLAEGLVGIATPVPLALYWLAAGLLVSPPWGQGPPAAARSPRARVALAAAVGLAALAAVSASSRWLLASVAYADGTRLGLAARLADAAPRFERARELMPWVALSGEAQAYAEFRLALREGDPARQRAGLDRAAQVAAETRAAAGSGAAGFALAAQIAVAQAQAGEPGRLEAGLAAFASAVAWRPVDSRLQAQWALALLEAGRVGGARARARAALAVNPSEWLALAVLAKAAALGGNRDEARELRRQAEALAPAEARATLRSLMP